MLFSILAGIGGLLLLGALLWPEWLERRMEEPDGWFAVDLQRWQLLAIALATLAMWVPESLAKIGLWVLCVVVQVWIAREQDRRGKGRS